MPSILVALALLVSFALSVPLAAADPPTDADAEADAKLALGGLDPVLLCRGTERAGADDRSVTHGGFVYRFASADSHAAFTADPARWGVQLDGACGAMPSAKGDPDRFAVHDERVYLFGSDQCRKEFMAEPAKFLEQRTRTVAVLVFEGVELLDFAGPGEVFAAAGRGNAFKVYTVATTSKPIVSQGFVTIVPEHTIETAPMPDILVIPGGGVGSVLRSKATGAWITRVAARAEHVVSVCNGAIVLADLGLLDGLRATTHRGSIARLRGFDQVTVLDDQRFVDNGKIITTAGVSAGIDGSLHLVQRLLGTEAAAATAHYMEYDWSKDGAAR